MSTGQTQITLAKKFMLDEMSAITAGHKSPKQDQVTVKQLVAAKLQDKRNQGHKSTGDEERRWRLHLEPWFGSMKATQVTTPALNAFIVHRQKAEDKPANAEINRELSFLRSCFNYALKKCSPRLVAEVPNFPRLKESAPRQGFITDDEYRALASSCESLEMRTAFELANCYAWRKNEIMYLRVHQYDPQARTLSLPTSKNGDPRVVVVTPQCAELLKALADKKGADEFMFRLRDIRNAWRKVRSKAAELITDPDSKKKVQALFFHDLRRSGAREMRKMGMPESIIMKVGGWRTPSMFRRYNIIDHRDMEEAARQIAERQERLAKPNDTVVAQSDPAPSRNIQ